MAPSDNLDVDGASYTIWLEHDGHARRRIIVPGGQGGQAYDEQLSGTWRLGQSDSLIVTLILQGVDIEGGTVYSELRQPFSVRGDTLRAEVFGSNQYHEVVILVRR